MVETEIRMSQAEEQLAANKQTPAYYEKTGCSYN